MKTNSGLLIGDRQWSHGTPEAASLIAKTLRWLCLLCLLTSAGLVHADSRFAYGGFTINGGGGASLAGPTTVAGTFGQTDPGVLRAGDYAFYGGFLSRVRALRQTAAQNILRLGEIPVLTALHNSYVGFTITAPDAGPGARFSFEFDSATPRPRGMLTLDATTGRLTYVPDPTDKQPFNLIITATGSGQTISQLVEFEPRPILPPEEDVLRPGHEMPADDAPEYVVRSDILSETNEVFNGGPRKTRAVTVSGKCVVIQNEPGNPVFDSYNGAPDIKTFTIFAERVVVRSTLSLRGTRVSIYAQSVEYAPGARIAEAGAITVVQDGLAWLTPPTVRAVLAYANDLYLYGYLGEAKQLLSDYDQLLVLFEVTENPTVDARWALELKQMRGEIAGLLHRLDSNLDYFGNPAGWVPNLSFEVNLGLFSSEIDSAMRVLYLSYWLGNVASNLQQKVTGMRNTREQLKADFPGLTNELSAVQARLPDLKERASLVASNLAQLQTALSNRVDELRREAEHTAKKTAKNAQRHARWSQVLGAVGGALKTIPVGQPILGTVGDGVKILAGMAAKQDLTVNDVLTNAQALYSLADRFSSTNLDKAVKSFGDFLKPLDTSLIDSNGFIAYFQGVRSNANSLYDVVKTLRKQLKPAEVPDTEVQALLARAKAQLPELNRRGTDPSNDQLLDKIAAAMKESQLVNGEITAAVQKVARLTEAIERSILTTDALSRDISAQNAVLDHRALTYLKEMERGARERLLHYHYYLVKAYEYRFLDSYTNELNLGLIFGQLAGLAARSSDGLLPATDFDALKAVYEGELASVVSGVVERYQRNPPARSAPVSLQLSADELADLNSGQIVRVNLIERNRISVRDEDLRISDVDLTGFAVAVDGTPMPNATIALVLAHSGISKVRRGTNDLLFRHDQQDAGNPFVWEARYDSNTGEKANVVVSPAEGSLLAHLLQVRGVPIDAQNLMLFSRPGLWADLYLWRSDLPAGLDQYRITQLTMKFTYDFRAKPANLMALDVAPASQKLAPYFIVDRKDLRGRQDGLGRFYRTYQASTAVSLTAPAAFGSWRFDRWVDSAGRILPGALGANPTLTLNMTNHWSVLARYVNTDSDEDGLPDNWETNYFGTLASSPEADPDRDGWSNFLEYLSDTSPRLADTDGDGMTDRAEGLAGTDPLDRSSTLRITRMSVAPDGSARIVWNSVAGKSYQLEGSNAVDSESWQPIGVAVLASGGEASILVPAISETQFYRVRIAE